MSYWRGKNKSKLLQPGVFCGATGGFLWLGKALGGFCTLNTPPCVSPSSQGSQRLEGARCISPIPGEDPVGLGRLQFLLFARISRKLLELHQTPQPGARLFLISDFIAK